MTRPAVHEEVPRLHPADQRSAYLDRGGPTLHLRRCILQAVDDPSQEWTFEKDEIRIGSMEDNDIVLRRRHGLALPLQDHPRGHRLRPRSR